MKILILLLLSTTVNAEIMRCGNSYSNQCENGVAVKINKTKFNYTYEPEPVVQSSDPQTQVTFYNDSMSSRIQAVAAQSQFLLQQRRALSGMVLQNKRKKLQAEIDRKIERLQNSIRW